MDTMKIEYLPIDSLRPYEGNAKLHPAEQIEQIKKSIQDYGFRDPVGIWNGQIVEGHGRVLAARELGMTEIPVIRLDDMTDEQRREYALVHNQTTMNSGFDFSVLDAELAELPDLDMDFYGIQVPDLSNDEYVEDFFDRGVEAKTPEQAFRIQIELESQEAVDACLRELEELGYKGKQL